MFVLHRLVMKMPRTGCNWSLKFQKLCSRGRECFFCQKLHYTQSPFLCCDILLIYSYLCTLKANSNRWTFHLSSISKSGSGIEDINFDDGRRRRRREWNILIHIASKLGTSIFDTIAKQRHISWWAASQCHENIK